jgi:hypothetical protein
VNPRTLVITACRDDQIVTPGSPFSQTFGSERHPPEPTMTRTLAMLLLIPALGRAQGSTLTAATKTRLSEGVTVRVTTKGGDRYRGVVERFDRDSMVIRGKQQHVTALASIATIDTLAGLNRNGSGGAMLGGVAGLFVGLYINDYSNSLGNAAGGWGGGGFGYFATNGTPRPGSRPRSRSSAVGTLVAGAAGALTGGFIGSAIGNGIQTERWSPVMTGGKLTAAVRGPSVAVQYSKTWR